MGFFENASNVKIFGGQFKDIDGDLYEFNNTSRNIGSFNTTNRGVYGSFNNGGGPSHQHVNFEAIKRDAHARAAAMRKNARVMERQYEEAARARQDPPRSAPPSRMTGSRQQPGLWEPRTSAAMDVDEADDDDHYGYPDNAYENQEPFAWASQPQPQMPQSRPRFGGPPTNPYEAPSSRTAPPYLDHRFPHSQSPGYEPQSHPARDAEPQQRYGQGYGNMRPPQQRSGTNPFAQYANNDFGGARNINSLNHTTRDVHNAFNRQVVYEDEDEDEEEEHARPQAQRHMPQTRP